MATKILDYRGRPIETGALTQEIATSNLLSVRQPWFPGVAGGLTPERLGQVLALTDQNDPLEYLTLAEEMEERDLHYHSVLSTRKLAVSGLSVIIESPSDTPELVKIADIVGDMVKNEAFSCLIADQLDALGKGFAVSEIMWDKSESQWQPKCYEHRDQRHFMFDRYTGRELRLRDVTDMALGLELVPYKFVQHRPALKTGLPIRGGLARLAATAFMCKSFTLKDWHAFAEVFGMPIRIGKYGAAATPDQKKELLRAVANIGTDAAAIIPDTMMIEFEDAAKSPGGDVLFKVLADWWDSQVSKGVLGQTMTMDNGSSKSQAEVHNKVREDIKDDDAKKLAATLRRDVIKPFVDLNFGPLKAADYPILRLVLEEPEDLKLLAEALPPFIDRGLRIAASEIMDKFGLEEPEAGAETLVPMTKSAPGQQLDANGNPVNQPAGQPEAGGGVPGAKPKPGQKKPPADQPAKNPALNHAIEQLTAMLIRGERLTADQRRFLATAQSGTDDEIDRTLDPVIGQWREVSDPLLDPIVALASSATTYEEFLDKLKRLKLDSAKLAEVLATLTFKMRGLGDAKDSPR